MIRYLIAMITVFSLIIGVTWYWVVMHPMAFLDQEYPIWKVKGDMVDRCEVGNLTVLGDSKAVASIAPNKIGPNTVNLAVGGGTTIDLLAITQRILLCKDLPKAVVLSMSLDNLNVNNSFWPRDVRFNVFRLSANDLNDFRKRARRYGDIDIFGAPTPFDIDAKLKIYIYLLKFPSIFFGALIGGRVIEREGINLQFYAETLHEKGQHQYGVENGNDTPDPVADLKSFSPPALQLTLLDDVLKLYMSHNIPVYFISPPYKESSIKSLKPAVRSDLKKFLQEYEKRYPNFHVIGELLPTLPNEDFGDYAHVNAKGTLLWSKLIAALLIEKRIVH